jgi:hypothetical protein
LHTQWLPTPSCGAASLWQNGSVVNCAMGTVVHDGPVAVDRFAYGVVTHYAFASQLVVAADLRLVRAGPALVVSFSQNRGSNT